jgi:hypothetical protein
VTSTEGGVHLATIDVGEVPSAPTEPLGGSGSIEDRHAIGSGAGAFCVVSTDTVLQSIVITVLDGVEEIERFNRTVIGFVDPGVSPDVVWTGSEFAVFVAAVVSGEVTILYYTVSPC